MGRTALPLNPTVPDLEQPCFLIWGELPTPLVVPSSSDIPMLASVFI